VRVKLTYANVISTLALFLVLSGGAAYAASNLGKNSVGPKQLKKNAVTTAKIKNEAVTAAKVKKGTLTGAQINVSTLGTVPSATTATNATNAANATNAQHAQTADAIQAPEALHLVGEPGEPHFGPTWGNFGPEWSAVAFYLDREGVVHIQGTASGNGTKTRVFTLPPGYRPATFQTFAATGNGDTPAAVAVDAKGEVNSNDQNLVALNGISFLPGQ
jgi:hypothetical protein